MTKLIKTIFNFLFCAIIACSGSDKPEEPQPPPDIPIDIDKGGEKQTKPVQLWIDAHANFSRFAMKENVTIYLQRIKETGFNEIYLDVKPGIGYALYDSDILPKLTRWGDEVVDRNWDYLGFWIEEAERLDIKVNVSISTLGAGYTRAKQGLVYDDAKWDGKTQMFWNQGTLVDIRDQTEVDAAFLEPAFPEVQAFVVSIAEEIVRKYPKLHGICLDYCRYYNGEGYGLGDYTIAEFEKYSGLKVTDRSDILTEGGAPGRFFAQWIEFRSMTVTNLVKSIRNAVKQANPNIEFHFWASAHWTSRYTVGQNWASKKYIPEGWQYTGKYNETGFADQLDVFSLGAYADNVWKSETTSDWSVENFVTSYERYIMGECKVNGSIGTYAYGNRAGVISDAVYLCLKNTDGLMVFELSHVINNNQWAAIKDGIERSMK